MKDRSKLAEKVKANVLKFAKEAGLDVKQLEADMQGEVVTRELANVRGMAQEFEINGTPFLIINEQAFPGAIPYSQIIDALKK
jgi:predicted DsbA family dithiol-disulfide isomerase